MQYVFNMSTRMGTRDEILTDFCDSLTGPIGLGIYLIQRVICTPAYYPCPHLSACIRTRVRSAGFPITAPRAPATEPARAFCQRGGGLPPFASWAEEII